MGATRPALLILLDLITLTTLGEEYRSRSPLLCNFLRDQSSSLIGSNIFLNTLFLKALNLCPSPKMREQVYSFVYFISLVL
jgi:hypothetical protein